MASDKANLPKNERRDAARAEAAALRNAQLKREARGRRITLLASLVGLLIIGALVAWIVTSGKNSAADSTTVTNPTLASATGGFTFGKDGVAGTKNEGAVEYAVYLDFMCPACSQFEDATSAMSDELREAGDITLIVHPIAILNRMSQGTNFSTRSAAAFAYIADNAPDKALSFMKTMFANPPKENSKGLTDEEMVALAKQAGVPDDVAAASVKGRHNGWVNQMTSNTTAIEALQSNGGFSTPTVTLNGTKYPNQKFGDLAQFKADILAAKK